MEHLTEIFKYLANTNTINFIIMVVLLGYIVKKMSLGKSFEHGIENIKTTITKSDETKNLSQKHFNDAQALIDGLPNDIKTLEKNSAEKIDIFKEKIKDNTKKSINSISNNIEKVISIEEKKISNLLTEKTSADAIELAKANIEEMVKSNPELHNQFIENSIEELDRIEL